MPPEINKPMHQAVINILLCDTFPGLLPENIPSHEYFFEKRFHPVDPNIIFKVYRALDGELPEHPVPDEIYLITGSNNAAYDNLPLRGLPHRPPHPHLPGPS